MVHNSIIHILNCSQILILSVRNMIYNMLWVSVHQYKKEGQIFAYIMINVIENFNRYEKIW
jgi:hypothetical protein